MEIDVVGSVVGAGVGVLALWVALIVALMMARPRGAALGDMLRLLPDVLRLVRRLAADRTLPRGARVRIWLLMVYLASPLDLVPDVIPVVGYADDAIVVLAVLRSVVRRAGDEPLVRHWPGTPEGLAAVRRLAGLAAVAPPPSWPPDP